MNLFKLHLKSKNILFGLIIILSVILRFTWLESIPPSLYTDEADQGYNAYSVLKTGKDEHGSFLPVSFRSFGDWKPPLQTYLMVPFIQFFGLNELSVRLPSAILGVFTIVFSYLLVKMIFTDNKHGDKLALLTAFFLSVSPWHILQGRSAMLVMVALFFFEGGILFFIKSFKNRNYLLLSSAFFALSIYAYYGLRVITPLMVLFLLSYFRKELIFRSKEMVTAFFIGCLLLLPLFISSFHEPDVLLGRARTVSVFYDQGVKLRQWELFAQDGINYSTLLSRFFHNNIYMYGMDILKRFLSHFDGKYLFMTGDTAQPFQIPAMGIMYLADFVLIISAIFNFLYFRNKYFVILLIWSFISFIPAALTFMTPASNRTFNFVVPLAVFLALGTLGIWNKVKNKYSAIFITVVYMICFAWFMKQYFISLPTINASWWNWGWREVVDKVAQKKSKYDNIIVSDVNGMPYIYFLFYGRYNPALFQKEAVRTYVADRFGFEHVEGFGKYLFPNNFDWNYEKVNPKPNTLYVMPFNQAKEDNNYTSLIQYPDKSGAFKLFEYED